MFLNTNGTVAGLFDRKPSESAVRALVVPVTQPLRWHEFAGFEPVERWVSVDHGEPDWHTFDSAPMGQPNWQRCYIVPAEMWEAVVKGGQA